MAEWYVKDLSKLTGVSVQTLHHYDRIHLLKPSLRLSNGYRVYAEKDLLRLQQIIALKFFGFELSQIKEFLSGNISAIEHFSAQAKLLEQKANHLLEARHALNQIISDVGARNDKSIPWETIIQLIEVYRMTQELEDSWVKEIFTPTELKQYAELKTNLNPEQQANFEKSWANLIAEVGRNLHNDPKSAIGIALGKQCMLWVNAVYGQKYAHLRTKTFEKGFAEGKGLEEAGLTPDMVAWLDKAMDAYWRDRIYKILDQIGQTDPDTVLDLWNTVLDDMYGPDNARKTEIYDLAFIDPNISKEAKVWLKTIKQQGQS